MKYKLLLLWPNSRRAGALVYREDADSGPEPLDGLSFLEDLGYELEILEMNKFPSNPGDGFGSLWQGFDPFRALKQIFRSRCFDAIICVGDSSAALYLLWSSLGGNQTPVLLIDPALDLEYKPRIRLQNFVLPRCANIVVYGSNQRDHLWHRYGAKVKACFIHHRIDTAFFRRRSPRRIAGRPQILSVGDDQFRDFETVCEAARGLNADFVIKTKTAISSQPPSNVKVVAERISFLSLRDLYENADLSILSVKQTIHACGINSLLESMSMSLPTIVTENPALADYTQAGENCVVIPQGDVEAMRSSVRSLLSDSVRSELLGDGGRTFVETHCAMPQYAIKLDSLLKSMINRREN